MTSSDDIETSGSLQTVKDRLAAIEARMGSMSGEIIDLTSANSNNLLTLLNELSMRIWRLEQALASGVANDVIAVEDRLNRARLTERRVRRHITAERGAVAPLPRLDRRRVKSVDEQWQALQAAAPLNFRTYQRAFEAGARSYLDLPDTSCSTDRHREARAFREFLSPYVSGNILDIGCGPQAVPSYLADADMTHVWGMDPLPARVGEPHPFAFYQGFGEFIPFANASFDLVVSGTTIDHYYLLDRGLSEARRVLRPNGIFAVWISLIDGSPAYDPYSSTLSGEDEEHLYHIDPDWFLPLMENCGFSLLERMEFSSPFRYGFLAFTKGVG
jgi:SAM-dependent methyltransferase